MAFLSGRYREIERDLERSDVLRRRRAGLRAGRAGAQPAAAVKALLERQRVANERPGRSTRSRSPSTGRRPTRRSSRSATASSPTASPSTSTTQAEQDVGDVAEEFLLQYYASALAIPPLIVVQQELEEGSELDVLGRCSASAAAARVEIRAAERGDKRRILELAERNARLALDQEKLKAERRRQQRVEALDGLQEALELDALPRAHRVLRHLATSMGTHTVASMVVFEGGAPKKADYRRFTIRGLDDGVHDDFAAMGEVLSRRLRPVGEAARALALRRGARRVVRRAAEPDRDRRRPGPALGRPRGAPGLPRARRRRRLAGQAHRGGLPPRRQREPLRARPRHARAPAAAARPRRGAPLRHHPPPIRRDKAMTESISTTCRRRAHAQARAAQHFGSPEAVLGATREELEAVPGVPGQGRPRPLRTTSTRPAAEPPPATSDVPGKAADRRLAASSTLEVLDGLLRACVACQAPPATVRKRPRRPEDADRPPRRPRRHLGVLGRRQVDGDERLRGRGLLLRRQPARRR